MKNMFILASAFSLLCSVNVAISDDGWVKDSKRAHSYNYYKDDFDRFELTNMEKASAEYILRSETLSQIVVLDQGDWRDKNFSELEKTASLAAKGRQDVMKRFYDLDKNSRLQVLVNRGFLFPSDYRAGGVRNDIFAPSELFSRLTSSRIHDLDQALSLTTMTDARFKVIRQKIQELFDLTQRRTANNDYASYFYNKTTFEGDYIRRMAFVIASAPKLRSCFNSNGGWAGTHEETRYTWSTGPVTVDYVSQLDAILGRKLEDNNQLSDKELADAKMKIQEFQIKFHALMREIEVLVEELNAKGLLSGVHYTEEGVEGDGIKTLRVIIRDIKDLHSAAQNAFTKDAQLLEEVLKKAGGDICLHPSKEAEDKNEVTLPTGNHIFPKPAKDSVNPR